MNEEILQQRLWRTLSFVKRHAAKTARHIPLFKIQKKCLHWAVKNQDTKTVKMLVNAGVVDGMTENQIDRLLRNAYRHDSLSIVASDAERETAIDILKMLINATRINKNQFCDIGRMFFRNNFLNEVLDFCLSHCPSDADKPYLFVDLHGNAFFEHQPQLMNAIFDAWREHLPADCVVNRGLRVETFLSACCEVASESILLKILAPIEQLNTKHCYPLLDRRQLSYATLNAFVQKGLDVDEIAHKQIFNVHGRVPHWENILIKIENKKPHVFEAFKEHYINKNAQQIKSEILQEIDTQAAPKPKRKM